NEIGEISDLIKKYNAGFVADMASDDPFKMLTNFESSENFTESCHELFSENLSIGKFIGVVIEKINKETTHFTGFDHTNCPVCNSSKIKSKFNKYDDRYACPGIFKIGKCSNCGHQFVFNAKGLNIGKLYTEFYPRKNIQNGYVEPVFEKKSVFDEWLNGDKRSAFRHVPEDVKALDVGCGDCRSLFYHKSRGCDATGIEADENVAFLKEKFGDRLIIGEFKRDLFKEGAFDYVTMDQVVEHFENPLKKLMEVKEIVRNGGKIVLSTPNSSGWGAKLFGKYWINWHTPYHLNLFSKKSIRIALETAGFKNIQIKTVTSSEWLNYQWSHILFYPANGEPSYFWSDEEKKKTIKVKKGRRKLNRYIHNVLHKIKINHIITRIFDAIGVGDNMLVIAEKK
ncbi:MAG TPA: class I SAM-dependent methyltransferase, partial [bacterium]|nr:class I SAM-dependent methyltransferase [bacterium]